MFLKSGGRSQWPRGLMHERSSPAGTLGSWVRIPLDAWIFVCVYFVFLLFCVVAALRRAVQIALLTVSTIKKLKKRPRSKRLYSHRKEEEEKEETWRNALTR
jgi:hypothetical protein